MSEETILELFPLSKQPQSNDLKTLLDAYTKAVLFRLADIDALDYRKSWLKARLVDVVYEHLMDTMDERVLSMSDEDVELVGKYLAGEFDPSGKDTDSVKFFGVIFPRLVSLGVFFFRQSSDGQDIFVAEEFVEKFENVEALREENPEKDESDEEDLDVVNAGNTSVESSQEIEVEPKQEKKIEVKQPQVRMNRSRRRQPVKKQQPIRVTKIGRNEPCHCGSGKKYKKCCWRKDR